MKRWGPMALLLGLTLALAQPAFAGGDRDDDWDYDDHYGDWDRDDDRDDDRDCEPGDDRNCHHDDDRDCEPGDNRGLFRRIASFPVFFNTDVDAETVAEIVAAADEGRLLVYTDSEVENIGFVDISDPRRPKADGVVELGGEPTSVAVKGDYALVCVNTSPDFVDPSGHLVVIDVHTRDEVATFDLGGQPDSIAVSPDGTRAAICIENERDEDLGDGEPPQLPAGFVMVVDTSSDSPSDWTLQPVDVTGLDGVLFPQDPEPEYVDINGDNIAVVTLQENNAVVLIDLEMPQVIGSFSSGAVDLDCVDTLENSLIEQVDHLFEVPREPDGVTWVSPYAFGTADEGDLFGGSRGFTLWALSEAGLETVYEAGNTVEHLAAKLGHYPEERSENKGTEPEGIEYGEYGVHRLLFVGSERANLVLVYKLGEPGPYSTDYSTDVADSDSPRLVQILPTGVGPEGLLAIPERDLFVVACEIDDRGDKIRSTLMIYERNRKPNYPTVVSANRLKEANGEFSEENGAEIPIPWGALSGLAADPDDEDVVYTIHDSFYQKSRVYELSIDDKPAVIIDEVVLCDDGGVLEEALKALNDELAAGPAPEEGAEDDSPPPSVDIGAVINEDCTVNLDLEGIAVGEDGCFYLASEGAGNLEDGMLPEDRPFESPNLIVKADADGEIVDVILLPLELTKNQFRFGLEGVALCDGDLYVAFQREWNGAGDPDGLVRIGRYDLDEEQWAFVYYPLDEPTSPNEGWVGLSEITCLDDGQFAVIERDNQGGPDARIKRIYKFSVEDVEFLPDEETPDVDVVKKTLVSNLLCDGVYRVTGGLIPEKVEGFTVVDDDWGLIVNDNDGVDDNNGETQLLWLRLDDKDDDFDRDDCKLENGDIGWDGATLCIGGVYVWFNHWIPKDDSPGEYIGFTVTVEGNDQPLKFSVKAGRKVYEAEVENETTWIHPEGTSGRRASGISYIDFCDNLFVDDDGDDEGDHGEEDDDGDEVEDEDDAEDEEEDKGGNDREGDGRGHGGNDRGQDGKDQTGGPPNGLDSILEMISQFIEWLMAMLATLFAR